MPAILATRCVMAFEEAGDGWSELWFRTNDASLEAALEQCKEYTRLRLQMMTTFCRVKAITVSDDSVTGDSLLSIPNDPNKGVIVSTTPDPAFSGIEVRVEATSLYRRSIDLRGTDGLATTPPFGTSQEYINWLAQFQVWSAFIRGARSNWAVRAFSKADGTRFRVTDLVPLPASPGYMQVTAPGHTFAAGDSFSFQGIVKKQYPGVKFTGQFKVQNPFANTSFEFYLGPWPDTLQYQGGAYVVKKGYTYVRPNDLIPQRFSSHKVGRPFGSSRGRKRVAKR